MSVVFHHPLPASCTSPSAHNHLGSTHPSLQWRWRRAHPARSSLSSSPSSSSYFKFPHSPLRCVYHHPAPADTIPTLLSSTRHPAFSNKGPFFAAQASWRCIPGVGAGVSIIARLPVSGSALPHGLPDGATTVWVHRAGVSPLRRQQPSTSQVAAAGQPFSSKKEDKLVTEGLITDLLPGCMFRVLLDNGVSILGYVSGKMRSRMVKVIVGDRVTIEVDRFDSSRGRIVYRLRSKDPSD